MVMNNEVFDNSTKEIPLPPYCEYLMVCPLKKTSEKCRGAKTVCRSYIFYRKYSNIFDQLFIGSKIEATVSRGP